MPHVILDSDSLSVSYDDPDTILEASELSPDWISFSISHPEPDSSSVRFELSGQNTRNCRITTDGNHIKSFNVIGSSAPDFRFLNPSPDGLNRIILWSRTWDNKWTVDIDFLQYDSPEADEIEESITGRIVCLWSDNNRVGLIPALDEVKQFSPAWVAVTKLSDGLVEGSRRFEIKRSSLKALGP